MIDPRISLAVQQASVAPAIDLFNQVRQQRRENEIQDQLLPGQLALQQQQLQAGDRQSQIDELEQQRLKGLIKTEQDAMDMRSLGYFATQNKDLLERASTGDKDASDDLFRLMLDRKYQLQEQGRSTQQTDEALQAIGADRTPDVANALLRTPQLAGLVGRDSKASVKSYAPVTDPKTGQVSIPTFDPVTNEALLQPVEGLIQETPEQKRQAELKAARSKKAAELREKRISDITTELGERNRSSARSQRPLKQAMKLVSMADQGLTGAAKLQLSRLIPGIDASDEALLSSTLNQLALEQLQLFKGPTTDFEFGITQNIAGTLGQSKEANEARIKSLDRNNWFNMREYEQFQKHTNAGGDPDSFRFDFGETVKTRKGVFTLQDLQDTAVENNLTIEETIKRLND